MNNKIINRIKQNFDFGWMFHKGDIPVKQSVKSGMIGGVTDCVKLEGGNWLQIAYFDKNSTAFSSYNEWVSVDIPHDWCVEDEYIKDDKTDTDIHTRGYLRPGIGCYRKEFEVPIEDKGKRITIEFDGVMRNSTVYVNGHYLGNHFSGYTPFAYDLTEVLRYGDEGENVILIKVDATENEGWWYEGAGIYRHVWLVKADSLHVARNGIYIKTDEVFKDSAEVTVITTI